MILYKQYICSCGNLLTIKRIEPNKKVTEEIIREFENEDKICSKCKKDLTFNDLLKIWEE